jgi:hypothetical protein
MRNEATTRALPAEPDVSDSGTPPGTAGASPSTTPSPSTGASPTGRPAPGPHPGPTPGGAIGSGWTEIFPTYHVDQPPGQTRHSVNGGEHHFWIYSADKSTFPGHDSGPRSELRFNNDYSSGQAQFEADIKVVSGAFNPCVMQIWGAATQATTFMALAMHDSLNYYGGKLIYAPIYDQYIHLNVIHDTATHTVYAYVNGQLRGTFADHGGNSHYFKCGLYGRPGMSARCEAYIKNIRIYHK